LERPGGELTKGRNVRKPLQLQFNGLVKLSAFNAHICPSKYSPFESIEMVAADSSTSWKSSDQQFFGWRNVS